MERTYITKNQINIYYYPNSNVGSFSISLYLRAGSMFESDDQNGSTHFFEHIVFRHLNRIYDGKLYEILDSKGLSFEASTYVNYVEFNITGAAKHFQTAATILSDIFKPFELTEAELRPERGRVKAEMREEDSASSLEHFCASIVWKNTALANNVSGCAKNIDRLGVKKIKVLQKQLLSVGNVFFYVAGNVSEKSILELSELVSNNEIGSSEKNLYLAPLPKDFCARKRDIHIKNANYTAVKMCFDSPLTASSLPTLYLLWDILFGGETSVLHDRLSEKTGLIYSFNGYIDIYENLSSFSLNYEVRGDKLIQSVEQAFHAFSTVSELTEKHLKFVLPQYTDNAPLLKDDPSLITSTFGYECHILSQAYRSTEERSAAFIRVTPDALSKAAKATFRPENLSLTLKAPKSKVSIEKLSSLFDILKI